MRMLMRIPHEDTALRSEWAVQSLKMCALAGDFASDDGGSRSGSGKREDSTDGDASTLGGVDHMSKVAALRMWWSGETPSKASVRPHLCVYVRARTCSKALSNSAALVSSCSVFFLQGRAHLNAMSATEEHQVLHHASTKHSAFIQIFPLTLTPTVSEISPCRGAAAMLSVSSHPPLLPLVLLSACLLFTSPSPAVSLTTLELTLHLAYSLTLSQYLASATAVAALCGAHNNRRRRSNGEAPPPCTHTQSHLQHTNSLTCSRTCVARVRAHTHVDDEARTDMEIIRDKS